MRSILVVAAAGVLLFLSGSRARTEGADAPSANRVQVVFSGGHDLDGRDHGRPVVLIAAALGVPADVFREAFTHVHPAPPGTRPTPEEARENKRQLLRALASYGVTNERLDEVSNYYRYNRSRGEMWPTSPAAAYALISHGKITGFVVTNGGSGYSSPPAVSVPGAEQKAQAQLSWSQTFDQNGAVSGIAVAPDPPQK